MIYIQTERTGLFFVFALFLGVFALGAGTAFGWHDLGQKTWATSNNAYLCESNLTSITYELITPCTEAKKAAASWNAVSGSNWTLTFTSGSQAPIHLKGNQTSMDDYAGEAIPYIKKDKIIGADIKFDLDYGFTDVSRSNSNRAYYDFESVALHEFGHIQWVGHSVLNADSVMQDNLSPNTIRDTPEKHDKDVLKARYPSSRRGKYSYLE